MSEEKIKKSARNQILTALLATIPTFTYGIQIGWLSPMAKVLKSETGPANLPVSDTAISWMAASLPLAAITGIPFFSYSSDKFGRKRSIIILSLLSSVSWLIKLITPSSTSLIIARIIAGLAAGGCFVVVPVYVKEISEDSWRGTLGSLVMTVCKLGVILVYGIGSVASYYVNQSVYLAIALGHAVIFNLMPESPVFLVRRGFDKEAIKALAWLRNLKQTDKQVLDEIAGYKNEERMVTEMPKVTILGVVRDYQVFGALRMVLTLMAMQTLSGSFAVMNYAADIFTRADTSWSPNTLTIFVGSLQLAGSFFTTMSIEKFGRKIPLGGSSFMVGLCMATLATCFLLSPSSSLPDWLPVLAVCLCIFSYGAGLAPVPFVIMAEVFSFQLRAKLAGVAMGLSFLCSASTVLFFTPIANQFGPYVVFYTFAVVGLLGGVYTIFFVPETKGKSLGKIKEFWRRKDEVQPTPV